MLRFWSRPNPVHIADENYDAWPVVSDFDDLSTALAFRDRLRESGFKAELTSDYPLEHYHRDDIALRVPPSSYGDATVILDGLA